MTQSWILNTGGLWCGKPTPRGLLCAYLNGGACKVLKN